MRADFELSYGRRNIRILHVRVQHPFRHKVPRTSPLSGVNGVNNAVLVSGNMVGNVMFYGPGAGSLPTASAVSADIINIAERLGAPGKNQCWTKDSSLVSSEELAGCDLEKMKNTAGLPLYENSLVLA